MHQTFALTLSPLTGRVSLRPVVHGILQCKTFWTFRNETEAQAFLNKCQATKVRGGETINGTYQIGEKEEVR